MHHPSSFSPPRRRLLQGALAASVVPAWARPARAAAPWPQKPVRLVVGFPPGSSPDALARTVADPLAQALGQAVIVENKVGAAGTIGVTAVARATDGHTIGLTGNGPLTTAKLLNPVVPYDVARDLRPISLVGSSPSCWPAAPTCPPPTCAACWPMPARAATGSATARSGRARARTWRWSCSRR